MLETLIELFQHHFFGQLTEQASSDTGKTFTDLILSCRDDKVALINAVVGASFILVASFIFPATQSLFTSRAKKKSEVLARKESILDKFSTNISTYVVNYTMYLKFSSFLSDESRKTYFGFDKQNAASKVLDFLSKTTQTQQPETILWLIESNYKSDIITELTKRLHGKIDELISINFYEPLPSVEVACDKKHHEISKLYDAIIQEMIKDLQTETKR